jgi:Ran GTPase-activating protein (RanGAP) involved in mRNA processing and transport
MDYLHDSQSQSAASRVSTSTRAAQDRLITAQLEAGVLPEAFIKRSSNLEFVDVDVSMYSIGDEQGLCLGRAIKNFDTLQKLNLNDNRLTGASVGIIMKNASPLSLQVLTLSSNLLRDRGASAVALFLSASNALQVLNLADCSLFCDDVTIVCKAILKGHSPFLRELDISRNQINVDGGAAVAEVLKGRSGSAYSCTLASVNLAWNHVGTQGIISISAALEANSSLTSLNLSGNAVTDQAGQRMADALFSNSALKELNLSQNLVGGCSCFVFSKAVKVHPNIMKLDLSRNPLGEAGARSFYRTILRGLRCFVIMRSCSYFTDDKIFNYSSPSEDSPYDLHLEEPYKRAVLTELMIMAGEDPLSCRFGHVGWTDGKPGSVETAFPLAVKDGVVINKTTGKEFKPPRTGKMVVHFYSSVPPPTMARAATTTAVNIIQAIVSAAREEDRVDYLRLLCFDVYCTTSQAQSMIQTFAQRRILGSGGLRQIDVVSCIWSRLIDTKNMYDFLCLNVPMQERRDLVNTLTIEEFRFNWTNPSGYWRLNLQKPKQRMVMKKIIAINSVEAAFSRRKSGRLDTSQEGNWFNFRNGKYFKNAKSKGQLVVIDQEYVDKLPKTGTLEFDYVSTTRPGHEPNYDLIEEEGDEGAAEGDVGAEGEGEGESHEGHEGDELDGLGEEASLGSASQKSGPELGPAISDDDFVRLLVTLQLSSRRKIPQEKNMFYLMELQLVSAKFYFTVTNVMQIMDCFSLDSASQTKVVVVLFSRIRDLYNMDQLLKGLPPKTQREVLRRLGCLNVLNPLKLAFDYHISMKHLDERILLTLLLEISPNEGTDQIVESPKTDVSVITFYGQLHRIVSAVRDDTLIFNYAEVGEKTTIVAWGMRRDALRKFLIGTKPLEAGLFRVISMYGEMQRHGTLTRGPIELQYNSHLKALASLRRAELSKKQAHATREAMKRGETSAPAAASSPRPPAD